MWNWFTIKECFLLKFKFVVNWEVLFPSYFSLSTPFLSVEEYKHIGAAICNGENIPTSYCFKFWNLGVNWDIKDILGWTIFRWVRKKNIMEASVCTCRMTCRPFFPFSGRKVFHWRRHCDACSVVQLSALTGVYGEGSGHAKNKAISLWFQPTLCAQR